MFGSLLAAAAPFIIDKIAGGKDDKVPGIPTPEEGSAIGQSRLSEMDAAFPGTTAWERLGTSSNQAGAPAAGEAARSAQLMQARELSNRSSVADSTNRAHILAAAGSVSPMAASSLLDMYNGGRGSSYDTVTQQGTRKTPSEIERTTGQAGRESLFGKAARGVESLFSSVGRNAGEFVGGRVDPFLADVRGSQRQFYGNARKFFAVRRKPFNG